jgi:hypothetical protein
MSTRALFIVNSNLLIAFDSTRSTGPTPSEAFRTLPFHSQLGGAEIPFASLMLASTKYVLFTDTVSASPERVKISSSVSLSPDYPRPRHGILHAKDDESDVGRAFWDDRAYAGLLCFQSRWSIAVALEVPRRIALLCQAGSLHGPVSSVWVLIGSLSTA